MTRGASHSERRSPESFRAPQPRVTPSATRPRVIPSASSSLSFRVERSVVEKSPCPRPSAMHTAGAARPATSHLGCPRAGHGCPSTRFLDCARNDKGSPSFRAPQPRVTPSATRPRVIPSASSSLSFRVERSVVEKSPCPRPSAMHTAGAARPATSHLGCPRAGRGCPGTRFLDCARNDKGSQSFRAPPPPCHFERSEA